MINILVVIYYIFYTIQKSSNKNISTILTRLLWKGYCNKKKWKLMQGLQMYQVQSVRQLGTYCRNVRREGEKLTSTLLCISF
jgi:hypothetical protein